MPSNVLSLTQLKSMPLNDQVKALLINGKASRVPLYIRLTMVFDSVHFY